MPAAVESQRQAPWALAYLFAAHFTDGSRIDQTPEDESKLEPGVRSAFYDVLQAVEAGRELASFALYNSQFVYAVDLQDGHFEFKHAVPGGGVATMPFYALPLPGPALPPGGAFRLVYFRDHQQDILSSREESKLGEHRICYRFGWEYDVIEGGELKTYTQTVVVG